MTTGKHKFLLYSKSGDCWNLVKLLIDEGHEAVLYIKNPDCRHIADGLVPKVEDPNEVLSGDKRKEWIIIADTIGTGADMDRFRKQGWRTWGGSKFADKLEKDRRFAMEFAMRAGLSVPQTWTVTGVTEAKMFIQAHPNRYVLKPHDNKLATYIADGVEDALETLDWWGSMEGTETMEIDIQQYISGQNVDVECWFCEGEIIYPANYTIETKRYGVDNLGPVVGCMTSVTWLSKDRAKMLTEFLEPLVEPLRVVKYTGPLSLNIMVSERSKRLYLLEFTPRIGYNAYYCLFELAPGNWGDMLYLATTPEALQEYEFDLSRFWNMREFGTAARVTIPPYPFEHSDKNLMKKVYDTCYGVPIFLDPKGYPAKVYPTDVMIDPTDPSRLICAGVSGEVAEVVAVDEEPTAAWKRVVETVKRLRIPSKYARLRDGIEDFLNWFPRLRDWKVVGDVKRGTSIPPQVLPPQQTSAPSAPTATEASEENEKEE